MKKLITVLVLIALALGGLSTCKIPGNGPIHVEASYPGQFYLFVGMDGPSGSQHESIMPSPTTTYSGDFYSGEDLWYIGVYAHKRPPEVPAPVDLGTLEVTVTGDFATLHGTAPLGSWTAISLENTWDHL